MFCNLLVGRNVDSLIPEKNLGCVADNSSLFVSYTQKNVINMGVAISKTIP